MATFLCSAVAVVALLQAPAVSAPPDPLTLLRARVGRDSSDATAWLLLAREYLRRAAEEPRVPDPTTPDSGRIRAALDTADGALVRATALFGAPGTSATGDSARVLRVDEWSARAVLAWATAGLKAGPDAWGPVPADLRVPPVLEELGENLLRACPTSGVLLTANGAEWDAAWYMRFARGLRPDLLVLPPTGAPATPVLRARLAADLRLGRRAAGDAWLAALATRRPVCITMAIARAPASRGRLKWTARPLVWVAGPSARAERVPSRDFVFAALRMALDQHDPWAAPALALYARAARATAALCEPLGTFKVTRDVAACRR
jgi:hypothetical protein